MDYKMFSNQWTCLFVSVLAMSTWTLTQGGCGGCSADSGEVEPTCPTSEKHTRMEAYTVPGWWGTSRTRYRTVSYYSMGNPVCCGVYQMAGDKCYKPGCGGCLGSTAASQPACRKVRTYSRQQSFFSYYNCGNNVLCTRTQYRRVYYLQDEHVCCPGYTLNDEECLATDAGGPVIPDPLPTLNVTCGVDKYPDVQAVRSGTPYIVGGTNARPNEYPWQVSLTTAGGEHICGGTLLDQQWVLTAAHCVYLRADTILVVMGDHRLSVVETTQTSREVSHIHVHPDFNEMTVASDIALLQLVSLVTANANVAPACLPQDPDADFIDSVVRITGWGRMTPGTPNDGNQEYPDVLQMAEVGVVDPAYCEQFYGSLQHILCATDGQGDRVRSSCYGDSGGPMTKTDAAGVSMVIGVASFGGSAGCARGMPFGYTNVAPFISWIHSMIQTQ